MTSETATTVEILDCVVIGAGPAGLSAAIYARQAGYKPVVIKGLSGSLVATTGEIVNYLGGKTDGTALNRAFLDHADSLGIEMLFGDVVKVTYSDTERLFTIETTDQGDLTARTVIYAAGSTPKKLGVTGEDLMGVSYCATCDGTFFEGDPVAVVVGGGDTAVEDAIFMSNLVGKVYLLVRGDEMRASALNQQELARVKNIEVLHNTSVTEVTEGEGDLILKLDSGEDLRTDALFVAIGQNPNTAPIADLTTLDKFGYIDSVDVVVRAPGGFFAAGDLLDTATRQISVASSSGTIAGLMAGDYLRKNQGQDQAIEALQLPAGEYLIMDPGAILDNDTEYQALLGLPRIELENGRHAYIGTINGAKIIALETVGDGIYPVRYTRSTVIPVDSGLIALILKSSVNWAGFTREYTPAMVEDIPIVSLASIGTVSIDGAGNVVLTDSEKTKIAEFATDMNS